jgi:hypothetical protein
VEWQGIDIIEYKRDVMIVFWILVSHHEKPNIPCGASIEVAIIALMGKIDFVIGFTLQNKRHLITEKKFVLQSISVGHYKYAFWDRHFALVENGSLFMFND